MKVDGRDKMVTALRDRLSRMSGASMRINESLELDEVLQGVLDSARSLTDARYAAHHHSRRHRTAGGFSGVGPVGRREGGGWWRCPEGCRCSNT